jgi:hypothetical protein
LRVNEAALIEDIDKIKVAFNDFSQVNDREPPKQKTNLEEYTLGLALSCPEALRECRKQTYSLFADPNLEKIFDCLKKNRNKKINLNSFKKDLPLDLADKIDSLVFGAEAQKEIIEEFNPKKEITFCFKELKKRYFQEKLNKLNMDIQEAEGKRDNPALKKLTKEFNKLTKQISLI